MLGFWLKQRFSRTFMWLLVMFLTLALAFCMGVIHDALIIQQNKLESLEQEFPVWMRVSDLTGSQTDGLDIPNFYIWLFQSDIYVDQSGVAVREFFTKLCLKLTEQAQTEKQQTIQLLGITQRESDPLLAPENGAEVSFFEGFSWLDFEQDRALCLVPEGFAYDTDTGLIQLTVRGAETDYQVIGTVHGVSNRVYVPWRFVVNAYRDGIETTESLAALVKDNTRLSEMKERMKKYFTYAEILKGTSIYSYAMTVFDSGYMTAHQSATHNIDLLNTLQPVFMMFCAGMGLLAGFVLFRTRKREYALLRSVGTNRYQALWLLTSEFLLAAIAGGLLFVLMAMAVPALNGSLFFLPGVICCFAIGIVIAQMLILRESALRSLQSNE